MRVRLSPPGCPWPLVRVVFRGFQCVPKPPSPPSPPPPPQPRFVHPNRPQRFAQPLYVVTTITLTAPTSHRLHSSAIVPTWPPLVRVSTIVPTWLPLVRRRSIKRLPMCARTPSALIALTAPTTPTALTALSTPTALSASPSHSACHHDHPHCLCHLRITDTACLRSSFLCKCSKHAHALSDLSGS